MRIVFFGTPSFASEILRFLQEEGVSIAAVVTQPDRPRGRSLQPSFSAVKSTLLEISSDIPLLQPEKASEESFLQALASLKADLFVVVAYGQILPQKLLDIPPKGCINVHASLLPKYRGAAPMQRSLMNGDKETGVAIQNMVRQLDAGDVIATSEITVSEEMTFGELQTALCNLSKPLLLSTLHSFERGAPRASPQDPTYVTLAPKITPEEREIDWKKDASHLHNLIRALSPSPGAWCWIWVDGERKRLKILKTRKSFLQGSPGELFPGAAVGCGSHALELIEVQPEGKGVMSAADWIRGQKKSFKFLV